MKFECLLTCALLLHKLLYFRCSIVLWFNYSLFLIPLYPITLFPTPSQTSSQQSHFPFSL